MSLLTARGWPLQAEVKITVPYALPRADPDILDGHVRIWSTDAIYNAGDPDYPKPKQLASMSHHSGTIHTVRFSHDGRYLASGADDKVVCIYILDPNPPSHAATFGT